jgi:hypothetical protein
VSTPKRSYALSIISTFDRVFQFVVDNDVRSYYEWSTDAREAKRFDHPSQALSFLQVSANNAKRGVINTAITLVRIIETPGKETRRIVPVEGAPFVTFARPHNVLSVSPLVFCTEKGTTDHLNEARLFSSQAAAFSAYARGLTYCWSDRIVGVAITLVEPTITVEEIE